MKKQNEQKNNLNLKPILLLSFSMGFAYLVLFVFNDGPEMGVMPINSNSSALLAQKPTRNLFAKRRREFAENMTIPKKKKEEVSPKAVESLPKVASIQKASSEDLDIQLEDAQDLVDTGEMDSILKAKEILEKVLAKDPNHDGSIKELAMIHLYDLDDPVKAQELLERSYDLHPEDSLVFSETLQLAAENGNLEQFTNKIREKVDNNPSDPTVSNQLAWAYARSGDSARAGRIFESTAHAHSSLEAASSAIIQFRKDNDEVSANAMKAAAMRMIDERNDSPEEKKRRKNEFKYL